MPQRSCCRSDVNLREVQLRFQSFRTDLEAFGAFESLETRSSGQLQVQKAS